MELPKLFRGNQSHGRKPGDRNKQTKERWSELHIRKRGNVQHITVRADLIAKLADPPKDLHSSL